MCRLSTGEHTEGPMAEGTQPEVTHATAKAPVRRFPIALADLAHDMVAAEAPRQLELLAAVTARWEAGNVPGRRLGQWTGGSVGSGIAPVVTSDIIYPLLTGTLAQVLGSAAVVGFRRRWWRRRSGSIPPVPRVLVTLDAAQIDAVRAECISHGVRLGLSRSKATVLADAMYGVLSRTIAESQQQP
jgi:hypothetical protein